MKLHSTLITAAFVTLTGTPAFSPRSTSAQEVNCANEFRSGKLYFGEKVYRKAVYHFDLSVKTCPDKAEYHARYAMALAQFGEEKLKVVEATIGAAGKPPNLAQWPTRADVDSVLDMYTLAGSEFEASLKADSGKQNVKFVGENRQHFWVARYNHGIKFYYKEDYEAASIEFDLARRINPAEPKAYEQGAVSLIKGNRTEEAAKLIDEGLVIAPDDTILKRMKLNLGVSEADDIIRRIDKMTPEQSGPLCSEADSLYTAKIDGNPKDPGVPNTYFDRGLGRLTCAALVASEDSAQSVAIYAKAAEDFHKCRELKPADVDVNFYQSALYNEIQASMNAGDIDKSVDMIKEFMAYDCKEAGETTERLKDADIWKSYAQALYLKGKKQESAVGLIISDAISKGNEVPVPDATKNAQEDAKKALGDRGDPTHVYEYAEHNQVMAEEAKSIQVWIWCTKKRANVYYLGKNNGEIDW